MIITRVYLFPRFLCLPRSHSPPVDPGDRRCRASTPQPTCASAQSPWSEALPLPPSVITSRSSAAAGDIHVHRLRARSSPGHHAAVVALHPVHPHLEHHAAGRPASSSTPTSAVNRLQPPRGRSARPRARARRAPWRRSRH